MGKGLVEGGRALWPRVLIVDDDADWSQVAAEALAASGIDASLAKSGEEALERLAEGAFDAAIVDVQMPERDGIEVVRDVRAIHGSQLPILISTGRDAATGVCAGLMAGADGECFKSEPSGRLVEALYALWRERAQ